MAGFLVYDLTFLVLFTLWVVWFLYKRRANLQREMGIAFLYRTQVGVKFIDYISKKFSWVLKKLKYVIILLGFILMGVMVWVLGRAALLYVTQPAITQVIKAPPVAPLIPYFPTIFGLESFFPPLYFTYFILALAIVAIVHEFSHGIFMRLYNIRIKSTGFAFFGPFLGAFVEQDDKQMMKKKNSEQMAVLGAGVFANVIVGLIFLALFLGFFYMSFVPSGYIFNSYAVSGIEASSISGMNNLSDGWIEIYAGNETYLLDEEFKEQLEGDYDVIAAYDDAPAVRAGLEGAVVSVGGLGVVDQESLSYALNQFSPGEEVKITTLVDDNEVEWTIILGEHPLNSSKSYLGVAYIPYSQSLVSLFSPQEPSTYYTAKWDGEFVFFVYYLLFWIMIINLLVALFNMLPVGILDGGRFFYLGVLSITRSEKFSKVAFRIATYGILFLFVLMMVFWFLRIF